MYAGSVDDDTRQAIDTLVERALDDAGLTAPPVRIERLLELLEVDRTFYDLTDPGLLRRFEHKVRVGGHDLLKIVKKVKLSALWLPDERRIMVDAALPAPKQRWASYHDVTHRLLPWHRDFFLGDTAQTLDPGFQEWLESEANYGASALIFCGSRFTREALDTTPAWTSVELLRKRYDASYVTTLRRYVEHSHDLPLVAVVSTPPWNQVPEDQPSRYRHVVRSRRFAREFSNVRVDEIGALVDAGATYRRGGVVGDSTHFLSDDRGDSHEFRIETFFNKYDCFTLITYQQRVAGRGILVDGAARRGMKW